MNHDKELIRFSVLQMSCTLTLTCVRSRMCMNIYALTYVHAHTHTHRASASLYVLEEMSVYSSLKMHIK